LAQGAPLRLESQLCYAAKDSPDLEIKQADGTVRNLNSLINQVVELRRHQPSHCVFFADAALRVFAKHSASALRGRRMVGGSPNRCERRITIGYPD